MDHVWKGLRIALDFANLLIQQQQQQAPHTPQQQRYPAQSQYEEREDEYQERLAQPNLEFYRNLIPSEPNGAKIEVILRDWFGKHDLLLNNGNFMQWLFPTPEAGANPFALPLTRDEAKSIRSDPVLKKRVRRAFVMILDVYGMTLNERNEFRLKSDDSSHLEKFISHKPAGMWVTRVLWSLKELGHKQLMLPWLEFLALLIYQRQVLPSKFRRSFSEFWVKTLDEGEQTSLQQRVCEFAEAEA